MPRQWFNVSAVLLLLLALCLDLAGKSYAGRAMTLIATGAGPTSSERCAEVADRLAGTGFLLAACGVISAVLSIARAEAGPHWPVLLCGGVYTVTFLLMV